MGIRVDDASSTDASRDPVDQFRRDNDYEIIREAIDFQIARHRSELYRNEGRNGDAVRVRREAIANLNDVRALLDPENPVTVEIARKLMRSYRADAPSNRAA